MATRKTKPTSDVTPKAKAPTRRKRVNAPAANGAAASYPTVDQIRARAYELYLERGGMHGNDLDDWLAAEQELSTALMRSA